MDIYFNSLGTNIEFMKFLANLMKQLPINLVNLALDLSGNDLQKNSDNMYWLSEGIK